MLLAPNKLGGGMQQWIALYGVTFRYITLTRRIVEIKDAKT